MVVDQPASIGALPLTIARDTGCQVAYLAGLAMRRIADLYPGEAKTDAKDAAVIADAARTMPHTPRSARPPHPGAVKAGRRRWSHGGPGPRGAAEPVGDRQSQALLRRQ